MSRGLPPADALPSTQELSTCLKRLGGKHRLGHQIVKRIKIITLSISGMSNSEVVRQVGVSRNTVKANRRRWQGGYSELVEHANLFKQGQLSESHFDRFVESVLQDSSRPGGPKTFTATQEMQIVALATEVPRDYDVPINEWTNAMLAKVAIAKGIVETISTSQVRRILKKSALTSS